MSTYTYKLKGARWLRLWTAAEKSSVYAAQSEAQKIADTLCDVPWTRAASDGPAMFPLTAAKSLDENPASRDLFDAALFCAEHSDGAHRAYANAAMYLFELPTTSGVTLNSVKIHVESDAYNALGARIAVHLLSSAELPTDCATVRTGAAHAEGVAARRTVERDGRDYWYSNSADVTLANGTSESPSAIGTLTQYLAVFVGMENYATSRNEWLEGASYIRNLIEIETDAAVAGWTDGGTYDCSDAGSAVLLAGGSSPTWLQPLPTVNVGDDAPTVTESAAGSPTPRDATMTISGTSGPISFVATLSLYGADSGNVSGSIVCTGPNSATSTASQDGETVTEEGTMLGVTTGSGTSAKTYLHYISSIVGYRTAQSYSAYLHVYIELPTFEAADAARGQYTVTSADAKWFSYLGGDQSARPNVTGNTSTGGSAGAYMGTYGSVSEVVQLYDVPATTSEELVGEEYFDPAANLRLGDETVSKYGMAAAVGDFSHAVATFEAGTQPPDAEVLGRLARMSRGDAGEMLYLHPESGTLASELDVLRPVPRFWRAASDPTGQAACQPGLSAWYRRPSTPSAVALGIVQRDAPGTEGVVSNPAFLQLTILALRAPSAFAARLVLENGNSAVTNHFRLRFVAWRCPAEQWDGSNAFGMAAMASMPSIYRSGGDGSVSWSVDCSGSLLRLGTRRMSAERIGVSQPVSGEIAAGASVGIPLLAPVAEGDIVLVAPEVLGFADGTGGASKWFGRPSDPSQGTAGWARYAHNLGWFPSVTGI